LKADSVTWQQSYNILLTSGCQGAASDGNLQFFFESIRKFPVVIPQGRII